MRWRLAASWLRALGFTLLALALTVTSVAACFAQSATPAGDAITSRDVLALTIAVIGTLCTTLVAIYSGYQTNQIKRAQQTADAAVAGLDRLEKMLLSNYDTNARTTRVLEQMFAPVKDEIHGFKNALDKFRDQFIAALVQIKSEERL